MANAPDPRDVLLRDALEMCNLLPDRKLSLPSGRKSTYELASAIDAHFAQPPADAPSPLPAPQHAEAVTADAGSPHVER